MSNAVAVKRQTNIDLLRITAAFLVILYHVATGFLMLSDMNKINMMGTVTYVSVAGCCVPLFLMISGKLFLDRNTAVPIRKLLFDYALKLVLLYVVWGLLYAIDEVGIHTLISGAWTDIVKAFIMNPKYHLWYLPMQTCIYFLFPLFFALAKYENGKYLRYVCIYIFFFEVIMGTIRLFVPSDNYIVKFVNRYNVKVSFYCLYFLLGYYISKKKWRKLKSWHCMLVFIAAIVMNIVSIVWSFTTSGVYNEKLLSNYQIYIFVAAISLYLAYQKLPSDYSLRMKKLVAVISRCTLFIYLIHPFVLERLYISGILDRVANPWIGIPVVSVITFVICLIPALVLIRIPVVNKWLL